MSPSQRCDHILDLIDQAIDGVVGTPMATPRATLPATSDGDATRSRPRALHLAPARP
jgi:hypothetical protein